MFWCHGVFTNRPIFSSQFPRIQTNHMRPYLIIDFTDSLYYHQSETKMADSNEDELCDAYGNLIVVSDEEFKIFSSSEDSVREDEMEIELGSAVSRPVLCIILPRTRTSFEISREQQTKNKPVRENAVIKAQYGSCLLLPGSQREVWPGER